jgi:prepilin peptidase CpaA
MQTAQILALVVATAAAVYDVRTRRIPNALTFGAAAAALLFHAIDGGGSEMGAAALGWVVGTLVFIVPFALRGLGGGDVKLVAALGAWLGAGNAVWLALYTGIAGGVLALLTALSHGYLRTALNNVWLLLCHWRVSGLRSLPEISLEHSRGPRLAYAVPILFGTIAVVWFR